MASLGHAAVGLFLGRAARPGVTLRERVLPMLGFAALALLPDLDAIGFMLGVPYAAEWGHRGAAHSILLALVAGALVGLVARSGRIALLAMVALASHGLLDALTDGGLGVALYWPFDLTRHFFAWRPIPVAPIGAGFLSWRGLRCALFELVAFAPAWLAALWPGRPGPA
jgi:inner membrane protein